MFIAKIKKYVGGEDAPWESIPVSREYVCTDIEILDDYTSMYARGYLLRDTSKDRITLEICIYHAPFTTGDSVASVMEKPTRRQCFSRNFEI